MSPKLLYNGFAHMADLSLATYNSYGHGSGRYEYINKLSKYNDIILLQEHWLLEKQIESITTHV